jgi:hypothetical protein
MCQHKVLAKYAKPDGDVFYRCMQCPAKFKVKEIPKPQEKT